MLTFLAELAVVMLSRIRKEQERVIHQKIRTKVEAEQKYMNQEICVRDILICPKFAEQSYGESNFHANQYARTFPTTHRLIDHIVTLARVANTYHEKYYCEQNAEGLYVSKPDSRNKITRLSLNEFSLYGSRPLKMEEFQQVVDAVDSIARNQHENVHLLLSSMPVITEDNQLLNMTLYVQCGKNPKIDVITKATASVIDPAYSPQQVNFAQQSIGKIPTHANNFIASNSNQSVAVSNNSIVPITTEGGAKGTVAVDVCFDHYAHHSKRLIVNELATEKDKPIPSQVDHIITSNSIDLYDSALISNSPVHVDPDPFLPPVAIQKDLVQAQDLNAVSKKQYSKTKVTELTEGQTNKGFLVTNPPFGSDYRIVAQEERIMGNYSNDLKPLIEEQNKKAIENRITMMENQINPSVKENLFTQAQISDARNEFNSMKTLFTHLSAQCEPSAAEVKYKTGSYNLKSQAINCIQNARESLSNLERRFDTMLNEGKMTADQESSLEQYRNVIKKDLKFQLQQLDERANPNLIYQLTNEIDASRLAIVPYSGPAN